MEAIPGYLIVLLAAFFLTAFVKVFTTLAIFSQGIGLNGTGFGFVTFGVAFLLSLVVMDPTAKGGVNGLLEIKPSEVEATYRPFLEKNSEKEMIGRLERFSKKKEGTGSSLPVLASAFVLGELKSAFQIGFIILVPFLVIDLVITNLLMALGVTQISYLVVSLPLKLLLFVAVDGWGLLAEKLLKGYV